MSRSDHDEHPHAADDHEGHDHDEHAGHDDGENYRGIGALTMIMTAIARTPTATTTTMMMTTAATAMPDTITRTICGEPAAAA